MLFCGKKRPGAFNFDGELDIANRVLMDDLVRASREYRIKGIRAARAP